MEKTRRRGLSASDRRSLAGPANFEAVRPVDKRHQADARQLSTELGRHRSGAGDLMIDITDDRHVVFAQRRDEFPAGGDLGRRKDGPVCGGL